MMMLVKFGDKYFQPTDWTAFLIRHNFVDEFIASGFTSPKRFIRERKNDLWSIRHIVERME